MNKQQDSKTNKEKPIKSKNKEKEIRIVGEYFLGEFTLEEFLEKEANLIIAKLKQEGNK